MNIHTVIAALSFVSLVACSSESPAPTIASPDDSSDSSGSADSANKKTDSKTDTSATTPAACDATAFVGKFSFKAFVSTSTGGDQCATIAKERNDRNDTDGPFELTIAKVSGTKYTLTWGDDDPQDVTFDSDACALHFEEKDTAHFMGTKAFDADSDTQLNAKMTAKGLTLSSVSKYTSDDPNAEGVPCSWSQTGTASKQ